MKQATIRSVCECQSQLEAQLDEQRYVLAGFAIGSDRSRERSPAHSIDAKHRLFDVGWLCPYCGRNTLRSFDADALSWIDADPPTPAVAPPPQPPAPLGPGPATGFSVAPNGPATPSIRPLTSRAPGAAKPPPPPPAPSPSARPPASASNPPNVSTAVALKSLSTPLRPPSIPPSARPASAPPPPPPAAARPPSGRPPPPPAAASPASTPPAAPSPAKGPPSDPSKSN